MRPFLRRTNVTRCNLCKWGYPIVLLAPLTLVEPITNKQRRMLNVCPICARDKMAEVQATNPRLYKLPNVPAKLIADAERWKRNHPEHGPEQETSSEKLRTVEAADHRPGESLGSAPNLRDAPDDEHASGDQQGGLGTSAVPHLGTRGLVPHNGE